MEIIVVPERRFITNASVHMYSERLVTHACHLNADLTDISDGFNSLQSLDGSGKRKRTKTEQAKLTFEIVALRAAEDTFTIEYKIYAECQKTKDTLQRFNSSLPPHATWKICLKFRVSSTGQRVEFLDKMLEFGNDTLSFKDTMHNFDYTFCNKRVVVEGDILVKVGTTGASEEVKAENVQMSAMCKKILQNMEYADAKIVASNGTQFPCHKVFLSAQSSFFQRMFASGMQESVSGTVTLDISENGVQALLNYIYTLDLEEARSNCETALELLIAGDQYEIPSLERAMWEFMSIQSLDWFSTSVAAELWQFANKRNKNENNENYKYLEDKAIAVLKSKTESEIKGCPAISKLLENPMEFCLYLLRNAGSTTSETSTPQGQASNG